MSPQQEGHGGRLPDVACIKSTGKDPWFEGTIGGLHPPQ